MDIAASGKIWANERRMRPSSESDAVFCCNFVLDTVLKLQSRYQSDRFQGAWRQFRVVKPAQIVLQLDKETIEVIREAEVGEVLLSYATASRDAPGLIAVLQDDEMAYVSEDVVEQIYVPLNNFQEFTSAGT